MWIFNNQSDVFWITWWVITTQGRYKKGVQEGTKVPLLLISACYKVDGLPVGMAQELLKEKET